MVEHKEGHGIKLAHRNTGTANTEVFVALESRLASALTSEEIRQKSTQLISQIRSCITSKPPDTTTAKIFTLNLKQLNRLSNYRNSRLKDEVQQLQSSADSTYLSFNNLGNEISHIRKNIAACLDFRSADMDLELVPLEKFYSDGFTKIGADESVRNDDHKLRLARLNFELAQRNEMIDTLSEMDNRKNLLASDIGGKINRLGQIRPLIGTIREASKPLLEILNLKKVSDVTPESRRKTQLLPKELKLLHLYCGVHNELYADETLIYGCEGDIEAVTQFERRQKSRTPAEVAEKADEDEPLEDEEEEEEGPPEKRRRIASNASDKHQHEVQSLRERILQSHPIALTIAIPCGDLLANLNFHYMPGLKCITVKSTVKGKFHHGDLFSSQHLFDDLQEEQDSGEECPNSVGRALLKLVEVNLSDHLVAVGKAYRFAQLIANLGDEATESDPQFEGFKAFVRAARQRVLDRLSLSNTLHLLGSIGYERAFPQGVVKKFDAKQPARLSAFKVDLNPIATSIPQSNPWQAEFNRALDRDANLTQGFHVHCNVDCGSVSLSILVYIAYSYPRATPIFLLNARQTLESERLANAIKDFEKALNLRVPSKAREVGADILATQFATLLLRLPIVFQMENDTSSSRYIGGKLHAPTLEQLLYE